MALSALAMTVSASVRRAPLSVSRARHAIETIQQALENRTSARGRRASERRPRVADVRRALRSWNRREGQSFPSGAKKELGLALLREPTRAEKLAGMILLAEDILPQGGVTSRDLPRLSALFRERALAEEAICDRFSTSILGPLIAREGPRCARLVADWRASGSSEQRRASGVAFVKLARRGDDNFAGFTTLLLRVCDATLRHPDRSTQTGAGWVLRELSRVEPERVVEFVEKRLDHFSAAVLRQATSRLGRSVAGELRSRRREMARPPRKTAERKRPRRRSARS